MHTDHLRCFLAAADTLHFGRAAQSLGVLPATLGRNIRQLEDQLGSPLFIRTTRSVVLSETGTAILEGARDLITRADRLEARARAVRATGKTPLRVGVIDSAAAGLMPQLLPAIRLDRPDLEIQLFEQKSVHLLPRLISGSLDIAFCRPPEQRDPRLAFRTLFPETAIVALPDRHPLSNRDEIEISDLADEPLIVPDRRSRPHSHDLTIKLFLDAGLTARIGQIADEKQTIVTLVASGTGLAIVPRWTSRLAVPGVRFVPLKTREGAALSKLVLAVAWARGTRDPRRDALLDVLDAHLSDFAATA